VPAELEIAMSITLFSHRSLTPALLAVCVAASGAADAQSLVRMDPVTCSGSQVVVIQYRLIETDGVAVRASGACSVTISDSRIVAGSTAVMASGSAQIEITDSVLEGGSHAIHASGSANVSYGGSSLTGAVHSSGLARLGDEGDNRVAAAGSGTTHRAAEPASIRVAPGTTEVRTGPAGVDLSALSGQQVSIGPGGIVVREGAQDVRIDASGQVRVQQGDAETRIGIGPGGAVDVATDQGVLVRVDDAGSFHVVEGDSVVTMAGGWVGIRHGDQVVDVHGVHDAGAWRSHPGSVRIEGDSDRLQIDLGATETAGEVHLQLSGDVVFDFDSAGIRADAARTLAQVAALIRQRADKRVEVVGHTDTIGSDAYNDELSRRRAVAVIAWLNQREGIPASLLAGRGAGSKQPVAHNTRPDGSDDPEGRARNRRVDIRIQ
jgi:outer membrane protein OmpA-like peptidoglycan-associated protein